MIVLDRDYDEEDRKYARGRRTRSAGPIHLGDDYPWYEPEEPPLMPWPRELAHHGDLRISWQDSVVIVKASWFTVAYHCDSCGQHGRSTGLVPESAAMDAAHYLAGLPCG